MSAASLTSSLLDDRLEVFRASHAPPLHPFTQEGRPPSPPGGRGGGKPGTKMNHRRFDTLSTFFNGRFYFTYGGRSAEERGMLSLGRGFIERSLREVYSTVSDHFFSPREWNYNSGNAHTSLTCSIVPILQTKLASCFLCESQCLLLTR
jgi:hypothetical protein